MKVKNKFRFLIFTILILFLILFIMQIIINKRTISDYNLTRHIVLDAGHGDNDPGTIGVNGIYEKDIALKLALDLEKSLKKKGFKVTMIRKDDTYVENIDRAQIANDKNASIYISIHCNAIENKEDVNGVQVLYYPGYDNSLVANCFLKEILKSTNANDKGIIEREDLIVLNKTKMPSFIIEAGFLSNKEEAELLNSDDYQKKIVEGIVNGIILLDK